MRPLPNLTFMVANIDLLDIDTLYSLVGVAKGTSQPVNVVFADDEQISSHKLFDKTRYRFLFFDEDFEDGSSAAALFDQDSEQTVFLVIAENSAVFEKLLNRAMTAHAPNTRFVAACRPFMAPMLMDSAVRLSFVHMPSYDESSLERSTAYALTRLQGDAAKKVVQPSRKIVRPLRRRVTVKLREKVPDLAAVEKMIALESLASAGALDKLSFSPPFAARGFSVSSSNVTEMVDYALFTGPMTHHAIFGPYLNIPAGDYRAGWLIDADDANGEGAVIVDIASAGSVLATRTEVVSANGDGPDWIWVEFSVGGDTGENVEFRMTPVDDLALRLYKIEVQSI